MDGEEGYFLGDTEPYDVVILDIGLPKMDGISVLEQWRRADRKMPVIILTARDRWSDKVAGMDAGADDYLAKPFHMEELLARVRAQVRRASGHAKSEIECGPLRLDTKTARVTCNGQQIKLTSHEYRLLAYLMHHNGRVVSRTELVEHLYEQDFDRDSNTIEVFIGRLRKKIPADLIETVRGLGYRLSETPSRGLTVRFNSLASALFATAGSLDAAGAAASPASSSTRSIATTCRRASTAQLLKLVNAITVDSMGTRRRRAAAATEQSLRAAVRGDALGLVLADHAAVDRHSGRKLVSPSLATWTLPSPYEPSR